MVVVYRLPGIGRRPAHQGVPHIAESKRDEDPSPQDLRRTQERARAALAKADAVMAGLRAR